MTFRLLTPTDYPLIAPIFRAVQFRMVAHGGYMNPIKDMNYDISV